MPFLTATTHRLRAFVRSRRAIVLGCLGAVFLTMLSAPAHATLRVVATVPDLAAIVRDVGGARVTVTSMSVATQDPHFVDAKPSLALDLSRADLLVLVGLDLEVGWLPVLLTAARNGKIQPGSQGYLDVSAFVRKLERNGGPLDRSMGDIHPGGNPHYLHDPRAAVGIARGIGERLASLDPAGAAAYKAGAEAFVSRLEAARLRWEARMAPFRGAPVVTYHRSWAYLQDWLGLVHVGTIEPKPGIAPNPQHVAALAARARAAKVIAILQEPYYPAAATRVLLDKLGIPLAALPAAADVRAGETYEGRMERTVNTLATVLAEGRAKVGSTGGGS